jgi:carbon-monoxide dehydrogenase medium subunit
MAPDTRWAFEELTLRHGDFAIVGVAALLLLDPDGRVADARLAFAGAAPTPLRAPNAERMLVGEQHERGAVPESRRTGGPRAGAGR